MNEELEFIDISINNPHVQVFLSNRFLEELEPTPIQILDNGLERYGAYDMVDEDIDILALFEYNPPIQFFDDMDVEEETQNDLSTLHRMELKVFEEPYYDPLPIVTLNLSSEQKKE